MATRYVHTNIIARDWKRVADFYQRVFGCEPLPPERDLSGEWLDRITGVPGSRIRGVHMLLPGHGDGGPTLEIFSYEDMPAHPDIRANTPGFAHIAFAVDDVAEVAKAVVEHGGSAVGELVEQPVPGVGVLTAQYLADPEGNMVEIMNWRKQ